MAKKQKASPLINTHSRIMIGQWNKLSQLVDKYSSPVKEQQAIENSGDIDDDDFFSLEEPTEEKPKVLSKDNIEEALRGPYQAFLHNIMASYALICRLRFELHIEKEDVFKGKRAQLPKEDQLPKQKIDNLKFSQLDEAQQQLEQLCDDYYQQWHALIHQGIDQLTEQCAQQGCHFTELEIKEFHDEEPLSELKARFAEINLTLDPVNFESMNVRDYLQLKSKLSLHNALNRQHQSSDEKTLQKLIKNLQKLFNNIAKQEKKLLAAQAKEAAQFEVILK